MWKEKLGGCSIDFYDKREIGQIIPRLEGATRKRIARRMRIIGADEISKTNRILDECFHEVLSENRVHFNQAAPTEWADLLEDIKAEYSRLSKKGNTHYGRYQTIEPLFGYLLYKSLPKYPECMQRINPSTSTIDASENTAWRILNPDKYRKSKRLLQTRKVQFQISYIQDLAFASTIFAYDQWRKSFIIPDSGLFVSNKSKQLLTALWLFEFLTKVMWQKGNALRERVVEEGLTDKKGIYPCLVLYSIKSLERDANKKVLESDKALCEIWDLPFSTFKDRMSELRSLDR